MRSLTRRILLALPLAFFACSSDSPKPAAGKLRLAFIPKGPTHEFGKAV